MTEAYLSCRCGNIAKYNLEDFGEIRLTVIKENGYMLGYCPKCFPQ